MEDNTIVKFIFISIGVFVAHFLVMYWSMRGILYGLGYLHSKGKVDLSNTLLKDRGLRHTISMVAGIFWATIMLIHLITLFIAHVS